DAANHLESVLLLGEAQDVAELDVRDVAERSQSLAQEALEIHLLERAEAELGDDGLLLLARDRLLPRALDLRDVPERAHLAVSGRGRVDEGGGTKHEVPCAASAGQLDLEVLDRARARRRFEQRSLLRARVVVRPNQVRERVARRLADVTARDLEHVCGGAVDRDALLALF